MNEHEAYIGLDSNIRPEEFLPCAVNTLSEYVTIVAVSQVWETPPYGMAGANFLNAALHLRTPHPANVLRSMILRRVEAILGRVRTVEKFVARTIDLDLLIFDGNIVDPEVWTLPHIAVPLSELIPMLTDSTTGFTLHQVARRLLEATPQMRPRPLEFHRLGAS